MSKWKCEICNSEFENFQAQGFNNKIYCPLCYFKKLYKEAKKEIKQLKKRNKEIYDGYISTTQELSEYAEENERLNNIINELEKYIGAEWYCFDNESVEFAVAKDILDKLKELKENKQ